MPDPLALVDSYPVVAFDMDGVLLDSFRCWWELLNDALAQHGKPPLTREQFELTWGQDVEADRRMFFPQWTTEQIMTHYHNALPRFAAMVDVEPDAAATLAALRRQGKKLAVATNSPMAIATSLLEGASLAEYFDVIAGVDLVAEGKPAPDLLHLIARETGVAAGRDGLRRGFSVRRRRRASRGRVLHRISAARGREDRAAGGAGLGLSLGGCRPKGRTQLVTGRAMSINLPRGKLHQLATSQPR
jgi:HAD superfamily hydrolase (TIGR01509 family)